MKTDQDYTNKTEICYQMPWQKEFKFKSMEIPLEKLLSNKHKSYN